MTELFFEIRKSKSKSGYWYIHITHRNGEPINHKYNSKASCKRAVDKLVSVIGVEKCKIREEFKAKRK